MSSEEASKYNVIDQIIKSKLVKGIQYEYIIGYRCYFPGFMAAGFIHSSFFRRIDLYSAGYWSYSNNYLADTKDILAAPLVAAKGV